MIAIDQERLDLSERRKFIAEYSHFQSSSSKVGVLVGDASYGYRSKRWHLVGSFPGSFSR
jgi:hypothetical protein